MDSKTFPNMDEDCVKIVDNLPMNIRPLARPPPLYIHNRNHIIFGSFTDDLDIFENEIKRRFLERL